MTYVCFSDEVIGQRIQSITSVNLGSVRAPLYCLYNGLIFILLAVRVAAYLPVCKSVFLEMRAFRLGVTFCVAQSSGHEPKVCAKRESSLKRLSLCACLALAPTCLKNTKKK